MLKIQVKVASAQRRRVKDFEFMVQEAWIEFPSGEVRRVEVRLPDGRTDPYAVGSYTLAPTSFEVNRFARLEIGFNVELIPFPELAQPRRLAAGGG